MPITAVTYWTASCNGCENTLQDITGGDYSAWGDPGAVRDELVNADCWVSDDGLVFCWTCSPRCLCGNVQSSEDDEPLCEDCDDPQTGGVHDE